MKNDRAEFISALDAVHLLSAHLGGDKLAKRAIIERLMDGAVRSTCWWLAHGIDYGRPYLSPPIVFEWEEGEARPDPSPNEMEALRIKSTRPRISDAKYGDGLALTVTSSGSPQIASGFWSQVRKSDIRRWRWAEGFVIATEKRSESMQLRTFALGVKFAKDDVLAIVGQSASQPGPEKVSRGRKLTEIWPDWVAEVITLNCRGEIDGLTANALYERVADELALKGRSCPSKDTVYRTAQAIVARVNEHRYTK